MTKHHTTTMVIPEGFYDFLTPQNERKSVESWEKWFASKGIETCVIINSKEQYVLCVKGVETKNPKSGYAPERKKVVRQVLHGL